MLGRMLVDKGLAATNDIEDCVLLQRHRKESGESTSLIELLVDNGVVTKKQIDRVTADIDTSQPAQQIPGYQILSICGAGANARVFKAKQISLDRVVAVKVLPKEATLNQDFVDRFYAEGRAAGKLNHPNIVGALDVGQAGEYHYFAMEFIEGDTIYDKIMDIGQIPEEEAVQIMLDTAKGLEHAHDAEMIHRDVKPQNIIITTQGVTKVTDLGLARAVNDATAAEQEEGRAFGTPYYISPEQILGVADVDFRADIYGLGATFYYMVTGKVPFEAETAKGVMKKHLKEELVPPEQVNKFVSKEVSQVIRVCMAKRRRERYKSTSHLVEDLEALKNGEPPLRAQSMLGVEQEETEEQKAERQRESAGAMLRSTLAEKREADKAHKKAELWSYLAIAGWLLAIVFLGMWMLTIFTGKV